MDVHRNWEQSSIRNAFEETHAHTYSLNISQSSCVKSYLFNLQCMIKSQCISYIFIFIQVHIGESVAAYFSAISVYLYSMNFMNKTTFLEKQQKELYVVSQICTFSVNVKPPWYYGFYGTCRVLLYGCQGALICASLLLGGGPEGCP